MKNRNRKDRNRKTQSPLLKPGDEELFLSAMEDVKRQSDPRKQGHYSQPPASKNILPRKIDVSKSPTLMRPQKKITPLAAGRSIDLDRRTLERLRRGHLRPEARLDLHGMTQDQAYSSLMSFIEASQACGKRCVIVITGRGRTMDGGGILRKKTPGWLNSPIIRSRVLAFATAKPRDGGVGALYVLLRRAQ